MNIILKIGVLMTVLVAMLTVHACAKKRTCTSMNGQQECFEEYECALDNDCGFKSGEWSTWGDETGWQHGG